MLFLAQARKRTVNSPGDDGMSEYVEDILRIIEAEDEEAAEKMLRAKIEVYREFDIRISLERIEIHEVIR